MSRASEPSVDWRARAAMSEPRSFRDDLPVAFVDIETTGGQAAWHRITEIGIVAAHGETLDFEWQTLVNPGVPIPPSITALTGIDDDMVRDAPSFEAVARELRERLAGRLFIAHNVRFDYHFIRGEFQRLGERWQAPHACTARLSRRLFPQQGRHNLDTLITAHGLACVARHRALGDAQVLWQFWRKLRRERSLEELNAALAAVAAVAALPPQLPPDLAEQLPERPGVYRFHGADDALIYVGKAVNLRQRVLGHFGGAHRDAKSQRLSAQTQRVEWSTTAGELGALLREAREVREQRPVYNRRLRGAASISWRWPDDAAQPSLAAGPGAAYGLFKSARDAQRALRALADEQRLCLKMLGLEPGEGSCFAYQLHKCRGACVGAEPAARHAVRARLALARWKQVDWPFAGAVALIERGADGGLEAHVVDDWRHCGTLVVAADAEALGSEDLAFRCRRLLAQAQHEAFNADVYRLLAGWLRKPRRMLEILPLGSGTMPE